MNHNYDEYINWCPVCGSQLVISGYRVSCVIPLRTDGFFAGDATRYDTYEETVKCGECRYIDSGLPQGTGWHYVVTAAIVGNGTGTFVMRAVAYDIDFDGNRGDDYAVEIPTRRLGKIKSKLSPDIIGQTLLGNKGACLQVAQLVGEELASQHEGNSYELVDLVTEEGIATRMEEISKSINNLLRMDW